MNAASSLGVPLGRYRLIALLGQGGMADVYLARTQGAGGFQKLLVVKLARFTGEPMFATMFLSEARLAAQLSHPNIIQTFEIGEDGTRHYIVMEYLDGGNFARLRQRLVKRGGIPLRVSLHILLQVLEGLEYAHEATGIDGRALRVVHRDLSPSNIMCTAQGVVKILDFGIAKAADSAGLTQTGKFSGKLQYMPPEQVRGERVDARADLFAVGVMLAESVLGQPLWGTMPDPTIAIELGTGQIPSLDRGIPIHPVLRQICEKALAPDRAYRYASARELKEDLAAFATTVGPPVSPRELAELVRAATEGDRAKLQAIIDGQLQRLGQISTGLEGTLLDLPRVEHTPTNQPELNARQAIDFGGNELSERANKISPPDPASAPRMRPARWVVLAGPALVAAVAGGIWAARSSAQGSVAPATASPAPERAALATVRFEVVVQPADARLTLDDKPLGANPFVGQFVRDSASHQLTASAPGYESSVQMVTLDRDASFRLSLARVTPVGAEPAAVRIAPPASAVVAPQAAEPAGWPRRAVIAPPSPRSRPALARPPTPEVASSVPPSSPPLPPVEIKAKPSADAKRALDTGALDAPESSKRALDTDVLDSGSNKPKPALDRENPWPN